MNIGDAWDMGELECEVKYLKEQIEVLKNKFASAIASAEEADKAWQESESRYLRLCNILGIDYTLEEPENVEQAIKRIIRERDAERAAHEQTKKELAEINSLLARALSNGLKAEAQWAEAHNRAERLEAGLAALKERMVKLSEMDHSL